MARRMPPVWFILKNGRSWPGTVRMEAPDPTDLPAGYEYIQSDGFYQYGGDGSPMITNGIQTLSLSEYYA